MAKQTHWYFMVHEAALAHQFVHDTEAVALVCDVFRSTDIDDEIERAPKLRWDLPTIEVKRDAVAVTAVVDRREFKAE
jgi:hypothetical protein